MTLETYDNVLEYFKIDFYSENFANFETFDDAYARLIARVDSAGGKNKGTLAALQTSGMKEGMRTLIEPHIEYEKAKKLEDTEEALSEYEDIYDTVGELPKGKGTLKLRQKSGRGIFESEKKINAKNRFLSYSKEDILGLSKRRTDTIADFFYLSESEVEAKLDEVGIEYDSGGKLVKK